MDDTELRRQLDNLARYVTARVELLGGLRSGNRDPLVEWTERLVAVLLDGELAPNPVQKDWDVSVGDEFVQVKYWANSKFRWVNEHRVATTPQVNRYALVVLESFLPRAVLVFPNDLSEVCSALGKRHPDQASVLQFTQTNYRQIMSDVDQFERLGMRVFDLGEEADEAVARAAAAPSP